MKLLLKMAWRNLWRNKRRTIITILAVVFAAMLTIAMRGMQLGTYEANINHAVKLFAGYIQIQRVGFQDNPSLQKSFVYSENLMSAIAKEKRAKGYAPRIYADGLVSYRDNSLGAIAFGIDPLAENNVSDFMGKLDQGRFFESDSGSSIVVGHKLLENLKAEIGDTVVVLAQGFDGSLGNLKYRISGTVKTGSPEFDGGVIFMGLKAAQELLAMEGRVNVIAISLDGLDQVESTAEELNGSVSSSNLAALSWKEVMPDLEQSIELDNISGIIFLWILIIVVGFGILNTVLMSVTERFQEFGVSLAVGLRNSKLVTLVILESMIIVAIGLIIGNILAFGINYYIMVNPIEIGGDYAMLYEEYGFIPRVESMVAPSLFVNSTIRLIFVSIVASIYPAYRVFKLEPLKGIRYT